MRPLLLEIEGLRSFQNSTVIDFRDVGLFAIVGDTGAGKSSILEAITYALYNASTWSQSNPKELICSDCEQMSVVFTFALGDREYKLTRKTARTGYPPPTHLLEGPSLRADGEKEVRDEVKRLIGLEWATFIKTMVLPQGKFSDLLTSTPGERTKILREILALDELKGLKDLLDPYRIKARDLLTQARTMRGALPSDPVSELERAKKQSVEAAARAEQLEKTHIEVDKLRATVDSVRRSEDEVGRLNRGVKPLDSLANELDGIVEKATSLGAERNKHNELLVRARAEVHEAEQSLRQLSKDGCDQAAIAKATDVLQRFVESKQRWSSVQASIDRKKARLSADRKAIAESENALPKVERECERLAKVEEAASHYSQGATNSEVAAQGLLKTLKDAEVSLKGAESALASSSKTLEKSKAEEAAAARDLAASAKALEEAEAAFAVAQRANAAADLSQHLHAGDNCPVCKRALPASFVQIRSSSLTQIKKRVDSAKAAVEEAREERAEARDILAAAKASVKAARDEVGKTSKRVERCKAELAQLGITSSGAGALAALKQRVQSAKTALRSVQGELSKAREEFTRKKTAVTGEVLRVEQFAKEIEAQAADLASEQKRVQHELSSIPSLYRPTLADSDRELGKVQAALKRAEEAAQKIEASRNAAAARVNELLGVLGQLSEEYKNVVELPLQSSRIVLRTQYDALDQAKEFLEATWHMPDPPSDEGDIVGLAAWCRSLMAVRAGATSDFEQLTARNRAMLNSAHERIERLILGAGIATEAELYNVQVQAVALATRSKERASELEALLGQASDLDAHLEKIRPFSEALDVLHAMLGDGGFIRYVVEKRELRLLSIASEIFGRMTGGRYGFAAGAKIVDKESSQERGARTLSGGETFLASLALSLALVEIAVRAGGKLEALFLDEGFGSLDTVALDEAMQELERRASDGKTIGVITHIRGVTDYIDTILRVDRTSQGSVVRRVEDADAEALIREAQLEGLLSQH